MTVQFSPEAITASVPTTGSALVRRLVQACNDPGKKRIHMQLIELDDAELQSGLGLTLADIAVLRGGRPTENAMPLYHGALAQAA